MISSLYQSYIKYWNMIGFILGQHYHHYIMLTFCFRIRIDVLIGDPDKCTSSDNKQCCYLIRGELLCFLIIIFRLKENCAAGRFSWSVEIIYPCINDSNKISSWTGFATFLYPYLLNQKLMTVTQTHVSMEHAQTKQGAICVHMACIVC